MLKNLFLWIRKSTSQAIFDGVNDALETLEDGNNSEFVVSIPDSLRATLQLTDSSKKATKKKAS